MDNFGTYSQYYDCFYDDKDYASEAAAACQLIRYLQPRATSLLELGCGTGNHAASFSNLDFTTTGLDKSPEMVSIAAAKAIPNFYAQVADICHFQLASQFDAAVALFHVVSYLTGNKELIGAFQTINKHLQPGSPFVFDAWYSPAVYAQSPEVRIKRKTKDGLQLTRIAEPVADVSNNLVTVNYELLITDTAANTTVVARESHRMRHFSLPEMQLLCNLTGFEMVSATDLLTGVPPGTNTWAICFLLKKIGEAYPG